MRIKWSVARELWAVYDYQGKPLAFSRRLESLTRHFPDAEVEARDE